MMVIAVGLSSYNVALFHLVNHAFYKALLFLGAGAVIHAVSDNQDFRKYGGLRPFLPLTYSVMLIASLSLVAFPFMTGFYSKDFILESAYGQYQFSGTVVYFIATIGAMFTTLYSVKVLYLTFLTNPNGPLVSYKKIHENDLFMSLPLILLAIFSILFGYITKDIFVGLGSVFFSDNSLFIHPTHEIMLDTEFAVPTIFKLLPLFFTISLTIISIIFSEFLPFLIIRFKFTRLGYNIFSFFNQRFFIELLYNKYLTGIVLKLGGQTTKVLDKGSVELLGPYGLELGLLKLSNNLGKLDTGIITSYALYILIGLIFYILTPYLFLTDSSLLLLMLFALFTLNKETEQIDMGSKYNIDEESSDKPPVESILTFVSPRDSLMCKFIFGFVFLNITLISGLTGSGGDFLPTTDLSADLENVYKELDRLLLQTNHFINQFYTFIAESGINVVTQNGVNSIDVNSNVPESLCKMYLVKFNAIDGAINHNILEIRELIEKASGLEEQIKEISSNNARVSEYKEKLTQIYKSYSHVLV